MRTKKKENYNKTLLLLIIFSSSLNLPSFAQSSSDGRPRSAFGICCCKKESESEKQILYSCQFTEEQICPEGTKKYDVVGDCPNNLINRKYISQE